jgi:ABC-2 type transport system permease protein
MAHDKVDIVLEIPSNFESDLLRNNAENIGITVNAINGVKAGLGGAYLGNILAAFNNEIRLQWIQQTSVSQAPVIEIATSNWFNPNMNFRFFIVPGILAFLVTMIGGYMCALNIVKEKEVGTIEQINVTPIKKYQFIIGKLLPFWILGIFVFSVGLFGVARLVYGIIPVGSLLLLYGFLSVYLVAILGFGLLVSTYSETQQQAMSVAFFFVMIFLLMSGLFTPINSMPNWAKTIAAFNPVSYFIDVMRMIVLKGSNAINIARHFGIISAFALVLNVWAILNYRKRN